MTGEIVARSRAKWNGGHCKDCGDPIPRGDEIAKIAEEGATTKHGQGPGRWVCIRCATNYPSKPTISLAGEEYVQAQLDAEER